MLKIKDDVDIEKLREFGFKFKYDEETGEITTAFKTSGRFFKNKGLHFLKKKTCIGISLWKRYNGWIIDDNILWMNSNYRAYDFDFDTLYDLIKAGLVEKVEE